MMMPEPIKRSRVGLLLAWANLLTLFTVVGALALAVFLATSERHLAQERFHQELDVIQQTLQEIKAAEARDGARLRFIRCVMLIPPTARTEAKIDRCLQDSSR